MPQVDVYYTLDKDATLDAILNFSFQNKPVDLNTCSPTRCTGRVEGVVVGNAVHVELRVTGFGSWTLKVEVVKVDDPSQTKVPLKVGVILSGNRKSISRPYEIKWS